MTRGNPGGTAPVSFVSHLNQIHSQRDSHDLLDFSLTQLAPGACAVVSSFGAESVVLLHQVARIAPRTPVLFLDTGMHFAETIEYRNCLQDLLGLHDVRDIQPDPQHLTSGDANWELEPDRCCQLRKTLPLRKALDGFALWFTGRKQMQAATRARLQVFEADEGRIKVNPLARWTVADIRSYMTHHDLPWHPLVAQGFPSIGCAPCTSPVRPGEEARSGRWRGRAKTECGIHFSSNGQVERASAAA